MNFVEFDTKYIDILPLEVEAHVVVNFAVGAAMLDPGHFDTASGLAGWTLLPGS